jgi:hypothetical protein
MNQFWYHIVERLEYGNHRMSRFCDCLGIGLSLNRPAKWQGDRMTGKTWKAGIVRLMVLIAASLGVGGAVAKAEPNLLQPQGLNYAGIYALRQMEPNLTGSGVKFALICRSITYIDGQPQNDYRPFAEHSCFKDMQFGFHDQGELPAGISPHSTAICSILFGRDANALNLKLGQFEYQGAVPKAQADVYEFWHFLIDNVFSNTAPDADILTTDIGSQFEDWWTRGIESLVDHYGLIVVAGIGNGSAAFDPPLYPGACANAIGVGVVDSLNTDDPAVNLARFSLAHPEHSSIGPTADGRIAPDIVAPGNCLAGGADKPDNYEPTGNWSSFATPVVAGTIGLLVQKAKEDASLAEAVSPDGGNCVIKAILLNSAKKLPYWHKGRLEKDDDHAVPLDYIQGAGLLDAVGAYKQLVAGENKPGDVSGAGWDLNRLDKDKAIENVYKLNITEPNGKFITATLTWNKHYSNTYPFEPQAEKDSNFRLEIWAVDTNNPDNSLLLDYSDSNVDNLEHIYYPAEPNYTNYEIVVSYSSIEEPDKLPPAQSYGLAWNAGEKQTADDILTYDLNGDGVIDEVDFAIMVNNLLKQLKSPAGYVIGDINGDGIFDVNDLQIFTNRLTPPTK